ncbi:DODA-type extradiol aromatic ring-opening family dioxygenase [Maricaulis parjimensis]|uniref:DODA-type extradiol aromatic ring-opening family dioxygenase n=1 Tax=Maricaulis parjimensis TaxID=144023 RepID=UPI00193A0803|nr:class III extradiol ring-cleavage dioxygenase [Maricaulis parjimensis]
MIAPLFISHGAPDVLITPSESHKAMADLALPADVRAILIVSAHWEADPVRVQTGAELPTIHDFRGFGPVLESTLYEAPGAPDVADTVLETLRSAGLNAIAEPVRGRDHGAWIPMALIRPEADIPVFQVSLPATDQAAIALGRALQPLSEQGVQIIGSGSLTHSLRLAFSHDEYDPPHPAAQAFRSAILPAIESGDAEATVNWQALPFSDLNHPTPEHFRPLLTAMAAGGGKAECLHTSWSRGSLAMDIWRFGA